MTSEKVYKSRGYKCVTANSRLLFAVVSAHVISRSEVCWMSSRSLRSMDLTRPGRAGFSLLRKRVAIGSLSPPSRPSQSAYRIGVSETDVGGSKYKCTSSEVGTSLPATPTTGVGKASDSWVFSSIASLISVLFPAPAG